MDSSEKAGGPPRHRAALALLLVALAIYCGFSMLLIFQRSGLQYDEALLVLGSVHMRHFRGELQLPHDPDTWLCYRSRCVPLMTVRYVGSLKEFLALPLFAVFGSSAETLRLLSMALGAIGIAGAARLLMQHCSPWLGAMTALVLACSPSYVAMTVFDNGAVSVWMAVFGLLCLAVSGYLSKPGLLTAFAVGLAAGLGVWSRANFIWLLGAIGVAWLLTLRADVRRIPWRHAALAFGGAVCGAFPFLLYQVISRGGTFEAVRIFETARSFGELLRERWVMFGEVLLSDREHKAMWTGPPLPDWQRRLMVLFLFSGGLLSLWPSRQADATYRRIARITLLSLLLLAGMLFTSRLPVAEHHLVVLLPFAAAVTVVGFAGLRSRLSRGGLLAGLVALLYVGLAVQWQLAAAEGLRTSGGVGVWSDGIDELARRLSGRAPAEPVKILDWGLQNNLFVLSSGKVKSVEYFADATEQRSPRGLTWTDEVNKGGAFVLFGEEHRQFPAATTGFLRALAEVRPRHHRTLIRPPNAPTYAEVIEVEAGTAGAGAAVDAPRANLPQPIVFPIGDANFSARLGGFHQIEEGTWRWTQRNFSIEWDVPQGALNAASAWRVALDLHIPENLERAVGPITLSGRFAGRAFEAQTFQRTGAHRYTRSLPPGALRAGANRIEFSVDRAIPPSGPDNRELAIIVTGARLEPAP